MADNKQEAMAVNPRLYNYIREELSGYMSAHGIENQPGLDQASANITLRLNKIVNKASANEPIRGFRKDAPESEFVKAKMNDNLQNYLTQIFSREIGISSQQPTPTPKPQEPGVSASNSDRIKAGLNELNLKDLQYNAAASLKGSLPPLDKTGKEIT